MIITIPFKIWGKFVGITIWPFIFIAKGKSTETIIHHEKIHLRQQLECLLIFFYLIYLLDFLRLWFKFGNWMKAYKYICFEQEAYVKQGHGDYLTLGYRKLWAWRRYFK